MKTYKLKLTTHSGFITPFQADTLFGHLCWVVAYQEGEKELQEFLEPFKQGDPPFVLSDGFPGDFLPRPFSAEFHSQDEERVKEIKKIAWVNLDDFNRIRKGHNFEPKLVDDKIISLSTSTHNAVNRLTNTTLSEGGVYTLEEIVMPDVSIYIKVISNEWKEKVVELFEDLSKTGYGRKKSIGKGQFSVKGISEFSFDALEDSNGFVALSNFCPAKDNPTEGLYKTFVKYGKLGEEFTFCGNPFKKPLVMIKTGSVFKINDAPLDYYGHMIDKIAPAKEFEVVQYAYAFAVPLRYPDL